jgi:orotidine-5'-phosphate decarboxylase
MTATQRPRPRTRTASGRVAIALDGLGVRDALALVDRIGEPGALYKVGPALLLAGGPTVLAGLRERGKDLFLDLKFHDIPQTVGAAVAEAARDGAALVTLHAAGGRAMLRAAREAAPAGGATRLLAVTILTSLDAPALREALGEATPEPRDAALRLARLAREEGIDGVVASPLEARALRAALGPEVLIVTPGIRAAGSPTGDQKRTLGAREAITEGADILVVGRPIVAASAPRDALLAILAEVEEAAP